LGIPTFVEIDDESQISPLRRSLKVSWRSTNFPRPSRSWL
jgi:hypothetical protein